jgi:hypothetical protein
MMQKRAAKNVAIQITMKGRCLLINTSTANLYITIPNTKFQRLYLTIQEGLGAVGWGGLKISGGFLGGFLGDFFR